ncbi:MAG: NAD(P)-dependent oxidoreductase [Dongiaceae bacterium]
MSKFRVALSGDFVKADGQPTFPMFDLSPLRDHPDVELGYVAPIDGVMPAAGLAGYDALILLVPKFNKSSIPADGRLAIVARFGVGYDSVDVAACSDAGIAVAITPDGVRRPVAVAILTLILALAGKMMVKDQLTRQGPAGFAKKTDHMGIGLVSRTLGSVGIGNIGAEMFQLAKPFDMTFIAHDPFADRTVAESLGVRLVELETVFREADFVTINCPLTPETTHLVNAARLGLMKPSAYLINTARGPIVDQKALTKVLQERRIAGAGLDVLDPEPPAADDPILKLDNVILAPHALCWTDQCFAGIGASDVKAVLDVKRGFDPGSIVNRAVLSTPAWRRRLDGYRARFGT